MVGEVYSSDLLHFQHGPAYLAIGNLVVPLRLGGFYTDSELNGHVIGIAHHSQGLLDSRDYLASVF